MRLGVLFSAVLALAAFGFCADQPDTLLLPCPQGSPAAPGCNPSKNELRDARNAFAKGLKFQREKPRVLADAGVVRVEPNPNHADFHYRGEGRGLLSQVASAFGITATIDDSVVSRQVRFDIQNVEFFTAMRAACAVTHTFWTPLEEKQILILIESPENHRQFDRLGLRTFYVPGISAPQELNDIVNLLRTVFEI